MHTNHQVQKTNSPYLAWLSTVLFYFYIYILRVSPNVMGEQLMLKFHMTAQQFSTLGSLSNIAYAILQIPLGIMVDRVGVKKIAMPSIVLCIAGSLMFGIAESLLVVQLSRLLIGLGSASAFMCAIKIIADGFPDGKRGLLMGLTLTIGTIGPLISGKLLTYIISFSSWRHVFYSLSVFGGCVALVMQLYIPKQKIEIHLKVRNLASLILDLSSIIKNPRIILFTILAVGLYSPFSVISELWGASFIKEKYDFSQATAAHLSSLMFLGLAIGSLILPWLTEKFNLLNEGIAFCSFCLLTLFSVFIYGPQFSTVHLASILILLGFFCGAEMMCFTGALQVKSKNSGEIIGIVNTFNMLGSAAFEYFVGLSLDMGWRGAVNQESLRVYSTEQYAISFSLLTLVLVICCISSLKLLRARK